MCHAELRVMAARLVKTKHEQTDPATIDERHLAEIQDYLAGTALQKSPYAAEEPAGARAGGERSTNPQGSPDPRLYLLNFASSRHLRSSPPAILSFSLYVRGA